MPLQGIFWGAKGNTGATLEEEINKVPSALKPEASLQKEI
jgi:hypothetical protein